MAETLSLSHTTYDRVDIARCKQNVCGSTSRMMNNIINNGQQRPLFVPSIFGHPCSNPPTSYTSGLPVSPPDWMIAYRLSVPEVWKANCENRDACGHAANSRRCRYCPECGTCNQVVVSVALKPGFRTPTQLDQMEFRFESLKSFDLDGRFQCIQRVSTVLLSTESTAAGVTNCPAAGSVFVVLERAEGFDYERLAARVAEVREPLERATGAAFDARRVVMIDANREYAPPVDRATGPPPWLNVPFND